MSEEERKDAHIKEEKASGTDNEPNLKENRC